MKGQVRNVWKHYPKYGTLNPHLLLIMPLSPEYFILVGIEDCVT